MSRNLRRDATMQTPQMTQLNHGTCSKQKLPSIVGMSHCDLSLHLCSASWDHPRLGPKGRHAIHRMRHKDCLQGTRGWFIHFEENCKSHQINRMHHTTIKLSNQCCRLKYVMNFTESHGANTIQDIKHCIDSLRP